MGFVVADQDSQRSQRLLKQTDKHLIIVTYEVKKRLICPPEPSLDPTAAKKLQEQSFG